MKFGFVFIEVFKFAFLIKYFTLEGKRGVVEFWNIVSLSVLKLYLFNLVRWVGYVSGMDVSRVRR